MLLSKYNFDEMEKNQDVSGIIQSLNDSRWQNRYKAILSLIKIRDNSAVEDVRTALDDENHIVAEIAFQYLKSNNAFPEISPKDVDIYSFDIKNPYILLKKVSVTSKQPNSNDIKNYLDLKLKEKAAKLGANAVVNVKYRGMKVSGNAVMIKNIDSAVEKADYISVVMQFIIIILLFPMYFSYFTELNGYDILIAVPFLLYCFYLLKSKGHRNRAFKTIFFAMTIYSGIVWLWYLMNFGFSFNLSFLSITALFLVLIWAYVHDYKMEAKYYA